MQTSSKTNSFKGVYTALVTPFLPDGSIDWKSYDRLLDAQLEAKVNGVVACGTTGETPTLSTAEKTKLIERALDKVKGRALVIVGTGSNDTLKTIEDSQKAEKLGADALLVVTPYYNKPSQLGLEAHYKAVADSVSIPVILYNVPGRTAVSLAPSTVASLSEHQRIVGIKEASGSLPLLMEMRAAVKSKKDFIFLTGDDVTFWPFMACGGHGVISVASNALPRAMVKLYEAWTETNTAPGLALYEKLFPLFSGLFIEPNPVPLKTILSWKKMMNAKVRLPLYEMTRESLSTLEKIWHALPAELREDRV